MTITNLKVVESDVIQTHSDEQAMLAHLAVKTCSEMLDISGVSARFEVVCDVNERTPNNVERRQFFIRLKLYPSLPPMTVERR